MDKPSGQKGKLLYLLKYLIQYSNEDHPVKMQDMLTELQQQGIECSRKTIRENIATLREFGVDIHSTRGRSANYFIASREFELPEVKLLIDCVQASRFLTQKKTTELQRKLCLLVCKHDAKQLERQVHVFNRVKNMNESIYYNTDKLFEAISRNRKVSFLYTQFDARSGVKYKRGGKRYSVSPFTMLYDNERYYLLAYDAQANMLKHYRVDRMNDIVIERGLREGREEFSKINISEYTERNFNMFSGREEQVTLLVRDDLAGVIADRFGRNISFIPHGEDRFTVRVKVALSPQFYGWVFGLNGGVKIVAPSTVIEEFRAQIETVTNGM